MSPVLQVTSTGVAMIPPVTDRHVQRMVTDRSDGAHIVYDCAVNHWHTVTWDPGIISWILGPYRYVMIAFV